jgi:tetratricopeptide (TPR) repeat protein
MIRTKLCVQPHTPHDQSLLYELSHLYWQQRGLMAWLSGEVPHRITSSRGMASALARITVAHIQDLEARGALDPSQPLAVLEIGGGLGTFATQFLLSLSEDCGDPGRALLARLQYIFSDFAQRTVEDAAAMAGLAAWVERGVVTPARFDMRAPSRWQPIGAPERGWEGVPLLGVFSNYVCCVAGSKVFQRHADRSWHELTIQVLAEVPAGTFPEELSFDAQVEAVLRSVRERTGEVKVAFEFQQAWQPVTLAEAFGVNQPHHVALPDAILGDLNEATLVYPFVYIDCLRALRPHLLAGGFIMTSDYGSADPFNLVGLQEKVSQVYGNTVNYGVNFEVLRAFAAYEPPWARLQTQDILRSMHHAMLIHDAPPGAALQAAFTLALDGEQRGEAIIEYATAAHQLYEKKDYISAARFYRRCITLDPSDLMFYERAGLAALEGGCLQDALQFFEQGLAADPEGIRDFPFHAARCLAIMHRWDDAVSWYRRALAAKPHPITWTNLAAVLRHQGHLRDALTAADEAITLKEDYSRAWQLKGELEQALGITPGDDAPSP